MIFNLLVPVDRIELRFSEAAYERTQEFAAAVPSSSAI
jgi:hypothetical protein